MFNKETVDFILKNKAKLLKIHSFNFKNEQIAEDCLQILLTRLISKEYNIENPASFVNVAMRQVFLTYKRSNKRYALDSDFLSLMENTDEDHFETYISENNTIQDIDLKQVWSIIYEEIGKLPANQRDAVVRRLREENEPTNTEKANYRHGMLRIKERLDDICGDSFNMHIHGF